MGVTFRYLEGSYEPAEFLANELTKHLDKNQKILLLVPGGSSIAVVADASRRLEASEVSLKNLTVTLTDERYGPVGHSDSNWSQLKEAGFSLLGAKMQPVLSGKDIETTARDFAEFVDEQLAKSDYKFGFFGIGSDGHTAGIKPGSLAVDADQSATWYKGEDFERITITPKTIARLDQAMVYAVGQNKWPVLDELKSSGLSTEKQPAQALKQVPGVTIFSDKPEGSNG